MRLISWNMGEGSPGVLKNKVDEKWKYVLSHKPDVVLVQEAAIPSWLSEQSNVAWVPAYDKKRWGSAVVTKFPIKSPFDVPSLEPLLETHMRTFRGQIVGAVLELPWWGDVVMISVHTPVAKISKSDITPTMLPIIKLKLNSSVWRADVVYGALRNLPRTAKHFIFGGDWNTSRLFDKLYGPRGNQEFFDRMKDANFVECYLRMNSHEGQTWFRKGDAPYHLDHLFCDQEQATYVRNCVVDQTPALQGLSDHAMLILDFDDRRES